CRERGFRSSRARATASLARRSERRRLRAEHLPPLAASRVGQAGPPAKPQAAYGYARMDSTLTLAWVLIGAGFLLMVAELFIPSGGILSVLSACGILIGVAMTFFYSTSVGLWTLISVG